MLGILLLATSLLADAPRIETHRQPGGAIVQGTISDGAGVLPGATVLLTATANGDVDEQTADAAGAFRFLGVAPGHYVLTVSSPGFVQATLDLPTLAEGETRVLSVTLQVEARAEVLTVQGTQPLVDTSSGSIGTALDSREIGQLPSGLRNLHLLGTLVPTAVASGNPVFARLQDLNHPSLVSIGGGARRANSYLIDGVPHTDLVNRPSVNPSFEAVESLRIQVHTYDAETGRTGGGVYAVTTRSGANVPAGTAFYQARPGGLAARNFFTRALGQPRPSSAFHNAGGGIGGPLVRDRTFVWVAAEGYTSRDARNATLRVPSTRERVGDFSRTTNRLGQPVLIHDPLTTRWDATTGSFIRDPFPGNIIPPARLNPIALRIAALYPLPLRDASDGTGNFTSTATQTGHAMMASAKLDHRVTRRVAMSVFAVGNVTSRSNENFWEPGTGTTRFADPRDGRLDRALALLVAGATVTPTEHSVVTIRVGTSRLRDDDNLTVEFDPTRLGFSAALTGAMQIAKFPRGSVADFEGFGAVDPARRLWTSRSLGTSLAWLHGRQTVKVGAEFRALGIDAQSWLGTAGEFRFDRFFTSQDPLANGTATSGNAFASLLLGYPSGDANQRSSLTRSSPLRAGIYYAGTYMQDEIRLGSRLTLTSGVRLEHESGLTEAQDRFAVAFDPVRLLPGPLSTLTIHDRPVRGGLAFAGQEGAPRHQGAPPALKFAPRLGLAYRLSPLAVLRAGYGVYWAPWNYQPPEGTNYGQEGFVARTFINQGAMIPTVTLDQPFPAGIRDPLGAVRGALTGIGQQIEFVDQHRRAPWVQQYSADIERQVGAHSAIGLEYVGATGRALGLGGSNDAVLNINQLARTHLALGSALLDAVPNPFFGLPEGQGFAVTSPTVERRQLLRPFPHFGDILMRQHTAGRSQYHALVVRAERRPANGWGGRLSYTVSRLTDNQFGETNFLQPGTPEALDAHNLTAEDSHGLLDVPHRVVATALIDVPFGPGRRWLSSGMAAAFLGGWSVSTVATAESGFPIPLSSADNNAGLFTRTQRAIRTEVGPSTNGTREARLLGRWLTPDGFRIPPPFTLPTVPRIDPTIRGPIRSNVDIAILRRIRLRGHGVAEVKAEVINLFNTVTVVGPTHLVGSDAFGQTRFQAGFMRLGQATLRISF
jgi:hypothetical protein